MVAALLRLALSAPHRTPALAAGARRPRSAQGRPAVIIADHPSLLDVVFLMGALPRITYVAKESSVKRPLGSMLRWCGHIGLPAARSPADGAIALQRMIDALTAGRTLLVFPEGPRSPMHGLYPFQRQAFEAAIRRRRADRPGARAAWSRRFCARTRLGTTSRDRMADFTVAELPTIEPDRAAKRGRELAARIEADFRQALGLDSAEASRDAAQ